MESKREIPSLVDLCVRSAIDNLRYIEDVGETDLYLLKDILPHCTAEQLSYIEESSKGRDLSPVTDGLWKRFYEQQFGDESMNVVMERMKQKNIVFKWKQLYKAKTKEREEAQQKSVDKFRQRYAEDLAKKQSRQIQLCSKVPPSSSKRSFTGGNGSCNNFSNLKGNLMKKAKMEYLNSHEAQVHAAMRRNASQRKSLLQKSVHRSSKPSSFIGRGSPSGSKLAKPLSRG